MKRLSSRRVFQLLLKAEEEEVTGGRPTQGQQGPIKSLLWRKV